MTLRLIDLFCCAGGASTGYAQAGFEVVGVDIQKQPRYPFPFIRGDALKPPVRLEDFDLVWASPPCQAHSTIGKQNRKRRHYDHPDLVAPTRELIRTHPCWIMENVMGAPLAASVMLCGSMFGLDVRRHRLFETTFLVPHPPCQHEFHTPRFISLDKRRRLPVGQVSVHGGSQLAGVVGVHGHLNYAGERKLREAAMGIDWMDDYGLTQAIPPAYSEHIGRYAMIALGRIEA